MTDHEHGKKKHVTSTIPSIVIVDIDAGLHHDDVIASASALGRQASEHFGPLWNTSATIRVATKTEGHNVGEWRLELHNMPPQTVQGALGFHARQPDGSPILYVFAGLCAQEGTTWTSCASHEICEALADPYLCRCVQAPDGAIWAMESADACEAVSYKIDGVEVSDFCTPAYFEPETDQHGTVIPGQQFDWCKAIHAPFAILDGGYGQTFDPKFGWTQHGPTGLRAYRKTISDLGLGRRTRRHA